MAYNSDGYIMVDFKEVNFRQPNQYIEGLFERLQKVIGTNKFVLIINANGKTPLPSAVSITNGQYVIESYLYTFSVNSSDMLHIKRNDPGTIGTVLEGTLEAGEHSISFIDDAISDQALIEIFTLPELWHYPSVVNGNTLTLTFDAQAADVLVTVRII